MKIRSLVPLLALVLAFPLLAQAQPAPGRHPAYLHALTDLRDARWFLGHVPDGYIGEREQHAMGEIDRAIEAVQRAAYYDGKNVYEHPRADAYPDARGRLRRVSELLRKAREDVAQQEDNYQVRELQSHAVAHIDDAIRLAESVMMDRERMRDQEHDHEHDRDRDADRR
jgi:hypothetical protein